MHECELIHRGALAARCAATFSLSVNMLLRHAAETALAAGASGVSCCTPSSLRASKQDSRRPALQACVQCCKLTPSWRRLPGALLLSLYMSMLLRLLRLLVRQSMLRVTALSSANAAQQSHNRHAKLQARTFLAPAARCAAAFSLSGKTPLRLLRLLKLLVLQSMLRVTALCSANADSSPRKGMPSCKLTPFWRRLPGGLLPSPCR